MVVAGRWEHKESTKGKWGACRGSKITNGGMLCVCKKRQEAVVTGFKGIKQSILF